MSGPPLDVPGSEQAGPYECSPGVVDVALLKAACDEAGVSYADVAREHYGVRALSNGRYQLVLRVLRGDAPANPTAVGLRDAFLRLVGSEVPA